MVKMPKGLLEETKALVRLNLFLRHEVRLKEYLSFSELKALLGALKQPKKVFT